MTFFAKVLSVGALVILLGFSFDVNSAWAGTLYSQPYIGTNINLGTSEPITTRYYGYFFEGATLGNPPTGLGSWTSTESINKVRVKIITGASCDSVARSTMIIDPSFNIIGGYPTRGILNGDECDIILSSEIPVGTNISAIYLVSQNVFATEMVLDGSPNNDGISISGYNDAQVSGGFAFQLCHDVCDGSFITPSNAEKQITAFSFENLDPIVSGVIDEVNHTINLTVPYGTDLTNLVPTISISDGASVTPSSNVTQDFSSPVTYVVTGSDGATESYMVTVTPSCVEECYSNVLFLPGLMGSKLYGANNEELWVSINDDNHYNLALDNSGKSIDSTIHTKNDTQNISGENETGIVDEVLGANIYNSFIDELSNWKNSEHIINDYAFIPYDWRLSLEDIITNGAVNENNLSYNTAQDFSESFILKKLEQLQSNSKNGKVTMIGHSNGGLVAKALIQKLKDTNNPLYEKIDKVILVAVPQVGTPEAIVNLLHGTEVAPFGFIMKEKRSRQLSQNMPAVYNMLPSESYFTTVDQTLAVGKVVSFENNPLFNSQISEYGFFVSDQPELKNYILGTDGRLQPSYENTKQPSIGNSILYTQAENTHQLLDNWQPHPETKIIQVAGWGEETLAGLDYKAYLGEDGITYLSHKPRVVVDGDATVVTPSALWMSTDNSNTERWWVDLQEYNKPVLGVNRIHRDILGIQDLSDFIKSKIKDEGFVDLDNIVVNNTSTLVSNKTRLHYTLHSPLTLGVVDAQGRYTGMDPITKNIRQEIPDVTYKQIGEVQFISIPTSIAYTLKLDGYSNGGFSLDVEKQEGNNIIENTSFQGIPSSESTIATIDITPTSDVSSTILKIDKNGDGVNDLILNSNPGGIVIVPFYNFSGFLQPINDTNYHPEQKVSIFKAGSTVPVKFQLKNKDGVLIQANTTPVWLMPQRETSSTASIDEPVYNISSTSGNLFKWDTTSQQYIYNWSTKNLKPGFTYRIFVKLDDGNTYSLVVGLK